MEQKLFDGSSFDSAGTACTGGWQGSAGWDAANFNLLANVAFPFLHCPSSPILQLSGFEGMSRANYVAIAGSVGHPSAVQGTAALPGTSGYANSTRGLGELTDIISYGGVMPYNKSVTIAQITDGTSNTMMVAEQSNYCANTPSIASWYRSANGQVDCLSDGGSFFFGFFRDGNPASTIPSRYSARFERFVPYGGWCGTSMETR